MKVYVNNVPDFKDSDGLWVDSYCPLVNVKHTTRAGRLWLAINSRCKLGGAFQKKDPSYLGCKNTFKNFQTFVEWCHEQYGYFEVEENGNVWSLDKDLKGGHLEYGPDVCMFIPNNVNIFLVGLKRKSDTNMLGVTSYKGSRWRSQGKDWTGKKLHLGIFETEKDAHRAWQINKLKTLHDFCENCVQLQKHHKVIKALLDFAKIIELDILSNKETKYA